MQSQGIKINTKQTLKRDMSKSIPLEFSTKNRRSNFATVTAAKNKISISNLVIVMFSISIVLYFYMVTSIVLATVDRKATEEKVRQITTELSLTIERPICYMPCISTFALERLIYYRVWM